MNKTHRCNNTEKSGELKDLKRDNRTETHSDNVFQNEVKHQRSGLKNTKGLSETFSLLWDKHTCRNRRSGTTSEEWISFTGRFHRTVLSALQYWNKLMKSIKVIYQTHSLVPASQMWRFLLLLSVLCLCSLNILQFSSDKNKKSVCLCSGKLQWTNCFTVTVHETNYRR